MGGVIDITARLFTAGAQAYARKWTFLGIFALVFSANIAILGTLDLLPSVAAAAQTSSVADAAQAVPAPVPVTGPELPVRIEIPVINLTAPVVNPTTTNIEELDKWLLSGAVRYPTTARLNENGNVVLFGHSSYLPVVKNPVYKTFNGIQKLVAGDIITVYSSDMAYTYRVRTMTKENANDGAITLTVKGRVLTLSTCNSFGEKSDRFVVTADFVESHAISG